MLSSIVPYLIHLYISCLRRLTVELGTKAQPSHINRSRVLSSIVSRSIHLYYSRLTHLTVELGTKARPSHINRSRVSSSIVLHCNHLYISRLHHLTVELRTKAQPSHINRSTSVKFHRSVPYPSIYQPFTPLDRRTRNYRSILYLSSWRLVGVRP